MKTYISKEMKRLNHLTGEIEAVYHKMALKLGLSDSAMRILYTICNNGDSCLLQEICNLSGVSKQTINSAIRKLEQEGMVYLESAGAKSKQVCLTEEGKSLAEHTALRIIKAENAIFDSWKTEDVETYLHLTQRFLHAIREEARKM